MTDTMTALPTWDMTTIFPAIDSPERDSSYARLLGLIDQFEADLTARLSALNVSSKILRFMLIDAAIDKTLLEYSYSGKHLVMLKNSENAEARSKKILDLAFAKLKAKGFL